MARPGSRNRRPLVRATVVFTLVAATAVTLGALHVGASTPSTQSVTVPGSVGQTATVAWDGTIPAVSVHPTNDCNSAGVGMDEEAIAVTIPRKGYAKFDATFTFRIAWTPSNPTGAEDENDEVLTVNGPDGSDEGDTAANEIGSSDGGDTNETVVAHNLAHPDDLIESDHRFVPSAVFTHPQLAGVGLTEEQARESGRRYVTAVQGYGGTAYGWAMEDTTSMVKLVAEKGTGRLLGAHVMGEQASTLIQPLIQAMSFGLAAHDMARGQYWIHPALAEVVENALLSLRT